MCGHELSLRCKEVRIWALLCLTELNNTSNPRPSVTRVVMYTFSKIIGQQYQKDAVNHKPSDWGGRLSTSPCYCHGHLGNYILGSFCREKLGTRSDVPVTYWNICLEQPCHLNYRASLQDPDIFTLNCVLGPTCWNFFDLLKTQLPIILSEVIVSFVVMPHVLPFRAVHLGHLSAVSSARLAWKFQGGIYLLNRFLTDRNTTAGSGLVQQKTAL